MEAEYQFLTHFLGVAEKQRWDKLDSLVKSLCRSN